MCTVISKRFEVVPNTDECSLPEIKSQRTIERSEKLKENLSVFERSLVRSPCPPTGSLCLIRKLHRKACLLRDAELLQQALQLKRQLENRLSLIAQPLVDLCITSKSARLVAEVYKSIMRIIYEELDQEEQQFAEDLVVNIYTEWQAKQNRLFDRPLQVCEAWQESSVRYSVPEKPRTPTLSPLNLPLPVIQEWRSTFLTPSKLTVLTTPFDVVLPAAAIRQQPKPPYTAR